METLRQGLEVPENDKALTPAPQAEETPVAENAPAAADAPETAGAPEAAAAPAAPAATETPAATDTTVAEQSEAPAPADDDAPDGEAMLAHCDSPIPARKMTFWPNSQSSPPKMPQK